MIYPNLQEGLCKHPERSCCIGFKKERKNWIPDNCPDINNCRIKVGYPRFKKNAKEVNKLEDEKLKEINDKIAIIEEKVDKLVEKADKLLEKLPEQKPEEKKE